jgi:hypothetical protein
MRRFAFLLPFMLLAVSTSALAAGGYPDEYALRPLQLPSGMVQLKVPLVINLSRDAVAKPVWIPFELRLGLTSDLELRLFHPGRGLCIAGKSRGCDRVYNDLGVGILYSLLRERGMDLALLAALEVAQFSDPALLRIDVGVGWKLVHAPFSIAAWPYLGLGLNHRDRNGDSINVPVEFALQLSYPTALFFESGFFGDAHHFADTWSSPLGVGINYLADPGIDLGAEFKLTNALGNGSNTDGRLLIVYVALRN